MPNINDFTQMRRIDKLPSDITLQEDEEFPRLK